ncbi:hypothetical protein EVAR_66926_1 [Eumeta japonica]|uniref:Reverse transcriptase domain-containing protein n=1 Tax=Eumeta variegata TaxID=151549 RepID=A0A4C2A9X5_EUMVA|nr:hypothetical protein EVAR_66926_1 [Eumeta japonica]
MDEIMKALKRMKVGKAAGYDRVLCEMLGGGENIVASLLYQLFNKCWKNHRRYGDASSPRLRDLPVAGERGITRFGFLLYFSHPSPLDSCLYDLKEYERGLRMDELSVKCLLHIDDQVILASWSEHHEICK